MPPKKEALQKDTESKESVSKTSQPGLQEALGQFRTWFAQARKQETGDPTSVALATATSQGTPSVRMVLLKALDQRGFVFYTNLESRKALELRANPQAALCFYWQNLDRQVRIEGQVETVSDQEADSYFASRPRGSRLGAWASQQSQILDHERELEHRLATFTTRFAEAPIPRPPYWGGLRLCPNRLEFWSQGKNRLHKREVFAQEGKLWHRYRLYP